MVETILDSVGVSKNDVVYRCPFCESTTGSGHLFINYDKNVFHCYKCDIGGRDIKKLLRMIGYTDFEDVPTYLQREKVETPLELLSKTVTSIKQPARQEPVDYSVDLEVLDSYYQQHTTELSIVGRQYLYARGLTEEEISIYRIREGLNLGGQGLYAKTKPMIGKDYSGRVVVPSLYRGLVSFYVCRDYTGNAPKEKKYLNPPSEIAYSSEDVWNLELAKSVSRTVILCEGVFTAIAAGRGKYNAVATYGKSISEVSNSLKNVKSQGDKLIEASFDTYIVAYDADAVDSILSTCDYLSKRGAHVKFLRIPPIHGSHTDISDLTRDQYLDVLAHYCYEYTTLSRLDLICKTSL